MCARHVTVRDRVAQVPTVLPAIIGKLDALGDYDDKDRNEKQHNFIANHRERKRIKNEE